MASAYILSCLVYAKNNIHECTLNMHVHDHDTRSKANIALPKVRLTMIQKSFVYLAFKLFNNLPKSIQDLEPKIFEYRVKHWLITHAIYKVDDIEEILQYL